MAGRKQFVPLPDTIRVLGREYQLKTDQSLSNEGILGDCNNVFQVIRVEPHQGPTEFADSVLHEVLHAILHAMRLGLADKTEEKVVLALATGIIGVLQDNPQFAQWLIQQRTHRGVI